jgi:outer membrane protein assembly factor BamA
MAVQKPLPKSALKNIKNAVFFDYGNVFIKEFFYEREE